jgi:hypothetical protein
VQRASLRQKLWEELKVSLSMLESERGGSVLVLVGCPWAQRCRWLQPGAFTTRPAAGRCRFENAYRTVTDGFLTFCSCVDTRFQLDNNSASSFFSLRLSRGSHTSPE